MSTEVLELRNDLLEMGKQVKSLQIELGGAGSVEPPTPSSNNNNNNSSRLLEGEARKSNNQVSSYACVLRGYHHADPSKQIDAKLHESGGSQDTSLNGRQ